MVLFIQPPKSCLVTLKTGQAGRSGAAPLTLHHPYPLGVPQLRCSASPRTGGAFGTTGDLRGLSVTQLLLLHFPECPEMRRILYVLESFYKHQQA